MTSYMQKIANAFRAQECSEIAQSVQDEYDADCYIDEMAEIRAEQEAWGVSD